MRRECSYAPVLPGGRARRGVARSSREADGGPRPYALDVTDVDRSSRLVLDSDAVVRRRLAANVLDARLPPTPVSLRRAAWAGLQDSMPRAALLSLHARVEGVAPRAWEDPALVQVWGPHHAAYVVPAEDLGVFTLGRLPDAPRALARATALANAVERVLAGAERSYAEVGRELRVDPNALRYAAPTGRVLIRWDGAGRPTIRSVPAPAIDPHDARLELARRHLHVYGPATAEEFGRWSSLGGAAGRAVHDALAAELVPVRIVDPAGGPLDTVILAADEAGFRDPGPPLEPAEVRLLPSGDALTLLHGGWRELLVPDPSHRALLWTPRVWPGALLVGGRIVGTWRRDDADLRVEPWRDLTPAERRGVEGEATSLPLAASRPIRLTWSVPVSPGD